ncbi:MAG: radical SAM protein [Thermoplasmata archaeon]|nr:MAG: radical SAM protein [Thermoplasmata archaeon]
MTNEISWEDVQGRDLDELLTESRTLSMERHGDSLQCFIPGKMHYMHDKGKYPTVSITGGACALNCDHCQKHILDTMIPARDPDTLVRTCQGLAEEGNIGVLISGGSLPDGSLPWDGFFDAIATIKETTDLRITIHTGLIDVDTAMRLHEAGVDEFLIDVIGSEDTMLKVYHLDATMEQMEASLAALEATGKPVIPHIVVGLHYGEMLGEMDALEMVARHNPYALVIVVLRPIRSSPMGHVEPPDPEMVARFIALSRLRLPDVPIALSCARPPGKYRKRLDALAVEAGVNRIAMPAEEALERAQDLGFEVEFHHTCCSKSF